MAGGRPRNSGEEICPNPNCRKLGAPFSKRVTKKSSGDMYLYPSFRHNDGSKPCDTSKFMKNRSKYRMRLGEEYTRTGNEAITYHVYPKRRTRILENFPLKEVHRIKASRVVIYKIRHSESDRLESELKKSNVEKLDLEQINWFLKSKTGKSSGKGSIEFLGNLLKLRNSNIQQKIVITCGDDAEKNGDIISQALSCDMMYLTDKYGVLEKLRRKIVHRDALQSSCEHAYNSPSPTLPYLASDV